MFRYLDVFFMKKIDISTYNLGNVSRNKYTRVDSENIFNKKYPLRCHQKAIGLLKHIKIRKSAEVKITYGKSRHYVINSLITRSKYKSMILHESLRT